jgi:pyruvate/2-oxoglutarate dehydrogenase complex dihydrolipoamide dehydrogenase (E3) component
MLTFRVYSVTTQMVGECVAIVNTRGGGIIGLEMGTVYRMLGARLDVVEMMDGLM